jgi:hypothetical protein
MLQYAFVENAACNPQGYAQNLWIDRDLLKKSEPIESSSMSDKLFFGKSDGAVRQATR